MGLLGDRTILISQCPLCLGVERGSDDPEEKELTYQFTKMRSLGEVIE